MCYDIAFHTTIESIFQYLPALKRGGQPPAGFNATYHKIGMSFPQWPVVVNNNGLQLDYYTWGPVPKMLNTPEKVKKQRQMFLNARSEKVLENGTMWNAIRHQRCLIPATGFFEYRQIPGWKNKVAYYIRPKEQELFFIAGLWALSNSWDVDKPDRIPTFTLLTRSANPVMAQIHNGGDNAGRMPLMMPNDLAQEWLHTDITDTDIRNLLQYEQPSHALDYWPVNSVRKVKPDDATVIAPVQYEGLPALTV
ncbi:SOS response-associated peptidase [Chitinophaga nivalis]|uniref:Abasic site processing protein n=1 Tax=Chitinophaga nivalis TaxID=2991709 RepID=A0ABT3IG33_9BACT|nr:SOS response-associated peptidase [Chitinophaga nivalis]MCW3467584.1 SOS response-associated peptidase [Chitinophaga nivalis]MCW3482724.1 SOS response-associated peptidase [Chitinophaga nivalis]